MGVVDHLGHAVNLLVKTLGNTSVNLFLAGFSHLKPVSRPLKQSKGWALQPPGRRVAGGALLAPRARQRLAAVLGSERRIFVRLRSCCAFRGFLRLYTILLGYVYDLDGAHIWRYSAVRGRKDYALIVRTARHSISCFSYPNSVASRPSIFEDHSDTVCLTR